MPRGTFRTTSRSFFAGSGSPLGYWSRLSTERSRESTGRLTRHRIWRSFECQLADGEGQIRSYSRRTNGGLGQHYGLDTPLLDWTESPFLGLYFAFAKAREAAADKRAVYALSRRLVERKSEEVTATLAGTPFRPEIVEIVSPLADDNARLVSHRGLFTCASPGVNLEAWVREHCAGRDEPVLTKITIPEDVGDRENCLRALNLMNINHLTLFPDLSGATEIP